MHSRNVSSWRLNSPDLVSSSGNCAFIYPRMDTNEQECKANKLFASMPPGVPLALTRKTASDSVGQIYAELCKRGTQCGYLFRLAHVVEQSGFGAQPALAGGEHLLCSPRLFARIRRTRRDCFFGCREQFFDPRFRQLARSVRERART